MRSATWYIALGAAAAAVAAASVFLRSPSPGDEASSPATSPASPGAPTTTPSSARVAAQGGDLRLQLALLRAEVAALRAQVEALQPPAGGPPSAGDATARAAPDPVAREVAAVAHRQRMQEVAAAHAAEPTEAGWAASTRGLVQNTLASDESTRALVRDIDCRSRSCRVELSDDGSGALSKSLPVIVQRLGIALPTAEAEQSDGPGGERRVVLYMSRAGADGR